MPPSRSSGRPSRGRDLLRHCRRLLGRCQRGGDGAAGAQVPVAGTRPSSPPRCSCRSARARTAAASAASTSSRGSTRPLQAPQDGLRRPLPDPPVGPPDARLRRRWRRCTMSCGPARPATSGRAACSPGSSPRRSTRPRRTAGRSSCPCRTTTTSIYREEEREMIPLCLDQGVGCIPWSPLARGVLAGNRTRDGGRHTTRSSTDAVHRLPLRPADRLRRRRRRGRGRCRPRRPAGTGRPGLVARQAGGDGTDRRCDQEEAPEGGARRRGAAPCPRTRSARSRSPMCRTPCSGTSREPVAGGPLGSPRRVQPATEIGGGMRVALTVADFLNRAALVYGHRTAVVDEPAVAGLLRDADTTASSRPGRGAWPWRSTTSGSTTGSGWPSSARTPGGS